MSLVKTQLGLVDPKTGALVKSVRGLTGDVRQWDQKTNRFTPPLAPTKPAPKAKTAAPKKAAAPKKTAKKTAE